MKNSSKLFEVDRHNNDKRQLFIDATICSLANHGYKGTTVRQIARYAEVTPGLLTHYFTGKEALIAESYKYFAKSFLDDFKQEIADLNNPVEALKLFIDSTFDPTSIDPRSLRVWLVFWSLTLTEQELKEAHREIYGRYISSIEEILNEACKLGGSQIKDKNTKSLAIGVYALLDGLWLERCLDPETFTQKDNLGIVYDFVEMTTGLNVR